jgi:ankyrin repeat protein
MSSFLISQLKKNLSKENLNFILSITDEKILNDVSKFILSKNNKDAVLFLIENDKITKDKSLELFAFIRINNYWDMFLNLDFTKFDIHADNDYALRWSSQNGHVEVVKFLIEKGANIHVDSDQILRLSSQYGRIELIKFLIENGADIHAKNDYALKWSSRNGHIEVVKILLNSDLEYFSKNLKAIEIVKKHKLEEFYKKFGITIEEILLIKPIQSKDNIMKYISSHDLESLKKCDEFDFSMDDYYYFFESLLFNNIEINQTIFDFIKNKEDLNNIFTKISCYFNDETKNKYHELFKNFKLNEIKHQLEKLKDKLLKLESQ